MTTLISLGLPIRSLLAAGFVVAATATLSDAVAQQPPAQQPSAQQPSAQQPSEPQHPRQLRKQAIRERAGLSASDQLEGPYYVVNRYSGKCLNVKDASTQDLAPVIQYTCGSAKPNDKWWILLSRENAGYYFLNDNSYKCLNVKDA